MTWRTGSVLTLADATCVPAPADVSSEWLHSEDDRDIHLYISSPGGSVTAGLAIYDTM